MSEDNKKNEQPEFPEKPPLNLVQGYHHGCYSNLPSKSTRKVKEESSLYCRKKTGNTRVRKRKNK